jgi:hypothetical protein
MITRNNDGEIIFSAVDDRDELVSSLKEILATTDVGRNYKTNYYTKERADEDAEKLVSAAMQIAGGQLISSRHLQHALTLLIDSGEFQPRVAVQAAALEEPVEDLRPRDRNGKILTPEQLAWGEMTTFAQTATPDAIRQRKYVDGKFREFIQTNLRREMQEQPVGDGVTPVGQPTTKTRASQDLVDFVRKFHAEPSQNLRPRNNVVLLAGEQVPYPRFIEMVNAASNAHLL